MSVADIKMALVKDKSLTGSADWTRPFQEKLSVISQYPFQKNPFQQNCVISQYPFQQNPFESDDKEVENSMCRKLDVDNNQTLDHSQQASVDLKGNQIADEIAALDKIAKDAAQDALIDSVFGQSDDEMHEDFNNKKQMNEKRSGEEPQVDEDLVDSDDDEMSVVDDEVKEVNNNDEAHDDHHVIDAHDIGAENNMNGDDNQSDVDGNQTTDDDEELPEKQQRMKARRKEEVELPTQIQLHNLRQVLPQATVEEIEIDYQNLVDALIPQAFALLKVELKCNQIMNNFACSVLSKIKERPEMLNFKGNVVFLIKDLCK